MDCLVIFFSLCIGMPDECLPGDICCRPADHVVDTSPGSSWLLFSFQFFFFCKILLGQVSMLVMIYVKVPLLDIGLICYWCEKSDLCVEIFLHAALVLTSLALPLASVPPCFLMMSLYSFVHHTLFVNVTANYFRGTMLRAGSIWCVCCIKVSFITKHCRVLIMVRRRGDGWNCQVVPPVICAFCNCRDQSEGQIRIEPWTWTLSLSPALCWNSSSFSSVFFFPHP